MKIAMIVVRTLMGLLFIFASLTYFLNLIPVPELTGPIKEYNEGIEATGYFMPFLKATELLCGLAFLTGFFVPLATVVIAPIILNIFFLHVFIAPEGLPVAVFLVLANAFVAYYYRDRYKPLLTA